jgi:hypothetical protein
MSRARAAIPAKTRTRVLTEFNHKCAICGKEKPHLHHIDENPENNSDRNLIPLCPNCHLLDQHSPTAPLNPRKLELFRRYKDPAALCSEFEPLFRRFEFLFDVESSTLARARENATELVAFVGALTMGTYYGPAVSVCVNPPSQPRFWSIETTPGEFEAMDEAAWGDLLKHLQNRREEAIRLCIELLRYQNWKFKSNGRDEL